MVNFIRSREDYSVKMEEVKPKDILMVGSGLEVLRDIKERLERIEYKLAELDRRIDENMPEKVLTESTFQKEIRSSDDIVSQIVSEIRNLSEVKSATSQLTIVESKKIERIVSLLRHHQQLTSSQLAQIMNMSRTRANEYLKQMENLGIAEPILNGKEKFYRLKN